jgi:hypothetical protein
MGVQVLSMWPAADRPEPDYVRVHTQPEPFDDTVVLASTFPSFFPSPLPAMGNEGVRHVS